MCHAIGDMARVKIEEMRRYSHNMEQFLQNERAGIEGRIKQALENSSASARDEISEFYSYRAWQLGETFPELLRESIFVALYFLLESELNSVCRLFQIHGPLKLELEDIAGNGIFRAKAYLEKVAHVDFPDTHPSWSDILNFNRVRNVIVHAQGNLRDANKKLLNYVSQNKNIDTDQHDNIRLTRAFVEGALKSVEVFFLELSRILKQEHSRTTWNAV